MWFITGASRGFGRVWTEAALQRGDKVAATARNLHVADYAGIKLIALIITFPALAQSRKVDIGPVMNPNNARHDAGPGGVGVLGMNST